MKTIEEIYNAQQQYFATGITLKIEERRLALKRLYQSLQHHQAHIKQALQLDLGKSAAEAYMTEIGLALTSIRELIKKLPQYSKTQKVRTSLASFPSKGYRIPEPYGQVLIISPWNYPLLLCLDPLASAIAAGNCVMVKPSSTSRHTALVLADILQEAFREEHVACIAGTGNEVYTQLLDLRFDYIFYTGSARVGKTVMAAAARHLTPVTLELGGKSPCIIDASAKVELAVKRILFGKILNAGQTCVAPDYLLVHQSLLSQVTELFQAYIKKFLGKEPLKNELYPHIINASHFKRLVGYLNDGQCLAGGKFDETSLKIEPTLLSVNRLTDSIMEEEIFGPILPVITYQNLQEVIDTIQAYPKPLALYLFTEHSETERIILEQVPFGGGCINDTIMHLSENKLPFGGVGQSGMGAYHGKAGFDTFTHYKSVLKRGTWCDPNFRYHPYGKFGQWVVHKFLH